MNCTSCSFRSRTLFITALLLLGLLSCDDQPDQAKGVEALPVEEYVIDSMLIDEPDPVEAEDLEPVPVEEEPETKASEDGDDEDLMEEPEDNDPLSGLDFGDDDEDDVLSEIETTASPEIPDYKVELAVDDSIAIGSSGTLIVSIGAETAEFEVREDMVSDERHIPSDAGDYAEITPYGPGFEVSPVKQQCVKIHPSGSEVKFSITPLQAGELTVSANIQLYATADCSDSPVPKTAADLKVTVYVDKAKERAKKKEEFLDIFWEKLQEFWGGLLALVFGLVLFLLRKKLKVWFGFEEES